MMKWQKLVVNGLCYQLMWFACVFLQSSWLIVAALAYVAFHIRYIGRPQELRLILPMAIAGFALDSLLQWLGILRFESALPPLWLLALWMVFSTTLCHLFGWLHTRIVLTIALGAIGGAAAYTSAVALGAGGSNLPFVPLFWIMAIVWAGWFPLCIYLSASYLRNYRVVS